MVGVRVGVGVAVGVGVLSMAVIAAVVEPIPRQSQALLHRHIPLMSQNIHEIHDTPVSNTPLRPRTVLMNQYTRTLLTVESTQRVQSNVIFGFGSIVRLFYF